MARGLPRVTTRIADRTTRIASPGGGELAGCIVVNARKGPTDEPTLVRSESEYLNTFAVNGSVSSTDDAAHWSALNFLRGGAPLWVVRPLRSMDDPRAAGLHVTASAASTKVGIVNPANLTLADMATLASSVFTVVALSLIHI